MEPTTDILLVSIHSANSNMLDVDSDEPSMRAMRLHVTVNQLPAARLIWLWNSRKLFPARDA